MNRVNTLRDIEKPLWIHGGQVIALLAVTVASIGLLGYFVVYPAIANWFLNLATGPSW